MVGHKVGNGEIGFVAHALITGCASEHSLATISSLKAHNSQWSTATTNNNHVSFTMFIEQSAPGQ